MVLVLLIILVSVTLTEGLTGFAHMWNFNLQYVMLLTNPFMIRLTAAFLVSAKPNVTLSPRFKEVSDAEGFSVDCVASGTPTPEVAWETSRLVSNHSIEIIPGGQRLIVHKVSVKDWKHFVCSAKSETGRDSKYLDLNIFRK